MSTPLERFNCSDGEVIHVKVMGAGRPLVFLHGWTANHRDWLPFQTALAQDCRSYALDARGHGGHSPRTVTVPSLERLATDLAELLAHYQLRRPVLVGHSMGVLTIWEYLRRHGDGALAGVVLIDQSPKLITDSTWQYGIYGDFDADRNHAFIVELRQDFAEAVLLLGARGRNQRVSKLYWNAPKLFDRLRAYLRGLDPAPLIACWQSLTAADFRAVLSTISAPTLLIYGEQSHFYSLATARWVHERIAGSRLLIYEHADHFPQLWHRDRFVVDVRGFLAELPH
jgi:pimeloyl-ACP methyl ester carboxylesterase